MHIQERYSYLTIMIKNEFEVRDLHEQCGIRGGNRGIEWRQPIESKKNYCDADRYYIIWISHTPKQNLISKDKVEANTTKDN